MCNHAQPIKIGRQYFVFRVRAKSSRFFYIEAKVFSLQIQQVMNEFRTGSRRYCFKEVDENNPKRIDDMEVVQDMPQIPSDQDESSIPLIISLASLAFVTTLFVSVFVAYSYVEQRFCFAPYSDRIFREFKFSNSRLAGKRLTPRKRGSGLQGGSSSIRSTWRSRPLKSFQELEQSCLEDQEQDDEKEEEAKRWGRQQQQQQQLRIPAAAAFVPTNYRRENGSYAGEVAHPKQQQQQKSAPSCSQPTKPQLEFKKREFPGVADSSSPFPSRLQQRRQLRGGLLTQNEHQESETMVTAAVRAGGDRRLQEGAMAGLMHPAVPQYKLPAQGNRPRKVGFCVMYLRLHTLRAVYGARIYVLDT